MATATAAAADKFWNHLTAFYRQLGAASQFNSSRLSIKYGLFSPKSREDYASEDTVWGLWNHLSEVVSKDFYNNSFPGSDATRRAKEKIAAHQSVMPVTETFCRNLVFEIHDEFIQALEQSSAQHKVGKVDNVCGPMQWQLDPIGICDHLLTWDHGSSAYVWNGDGLWLFNYLLRSEQLVALIPRTTATKVTAALGVDDEGKDNDKVKADAFDPFNAFNAIIRGLMEKHRLLSDRLAERLPRGNYRACFDKEEKEDESGRLVKMDEIKWTTGLPTPLNELTNDYCRFNILSDQDVNAVLESVKLIAAENPH